MIPLVVIRPQPGCDATVQAARTMGLEAKGFPLFAVRPLEWEAPDPGSFDALLIGSANALRHGGKALERYRGKPAYAVGQSTAEAARAAGLDVVACGSGGLQSMLAQLRKGHHRLLRLCGIARVPLSRPPGTSIDERVVYESEALPMPGALAALLTVPAVVMLHSAEAARHFDELCQDKGINRRRIAIAALGPRIARAAGEGWSAAASADAPNDQALLALARDLCQTLRSQDT